MSVSTRHTATPSSRQCVTICSTASRSPESTVEVGLAEMAATTPTWPASRCRASSNPSPTMAIPPAPWRRSRARARWQANRAAASTSRLPATAAAAISPTECPITAAGVSPRARQVCARATWVAKVNACTSTPLHGPPAVNASRGVQPNSSRNTSASASTAAAKTGSSRSSCRPMPAHCAPCPEKTQTTGAGSATVRPRATCGVDLPSATSRSRSTSSPGEAASTAARCGRCERRCARVCPTDGRDAPGCATSQSAVRVASAATPASDIAESGNTDGRVPVVTSAGTVVAAASAVVSPADAVGAGGASWRMTCEMEPPTP